MSTKEIIVRELENVPQEELPGLLRFIQALKSRKADDCAPALLAESSLRKEWLSPEEEAAWADWRLLPATRCR
jgi:hypothetical protein